MPPGGAVDPALPLVAEETSFALKGGTAINRFIRNMPVWSPAWKRR
jgi:hypothetical protein